MGITTRLIEILLLSEVIIFTLLLLPSPLKSLFIRIFSGKNIIFKGIGNVFLIFYSMIGLMFIDSFYKILKCKDLIPLYHAQRNFYLTSFTLYLALVFYFFVRVLVKLEKDECKAHVLKKQSLNQSDFVQNLIVELEDKTKRLKELEEKVKKDEALVKQAKNNEKNYIDALVKCNELKEEFKGENKKKK